MIGEKSKNQKAFYIPTMMYVVTWVACLVLTSGSVLKYGVWDLLMKTNMKEKVKCYPENSKRIFHGT